MIFCLSLIISKIDPSEPEFLRVIPPLARTRISYLYLFLSLSINFFSRSMPVIFSLKMNLALSLADRYKISLTDLADMVAG